ncbi:MAG: Flp family type IVb pilin [Terracidiphilus sp.]
MAEIILKVRMKFKDLMHGEVGQDLVEYALLTVLIALACIGGVKHIAAEVNIAFSNVSGSLG